MGKHLRTRCEKLRVACKRRRTLPKSLQNDYVTTWKPSDRTGRSRKHSDSSNDYSASIRSTKSKQKCKKLKTSNQVIRNVANSTEDCTVKFVEIQKNGKVENDNPAEKKLQPESKINSEISTVNGKTFVTFNLQRSQEDTSEEEQNTDGEKEVNANTTAEVTPLKMTVRSLSGCGAISSSDEENSDPELDFVDDDADEDYEPDKKLLKSLDTQTYTSRPWKSPWKQEEEISTNQNHSDKRKHYDPKKSKSRSLSAKLNTLKKQLKEDSVQPLLDIKLCQTDDTWHLKPTQYPILTSINGNNFEILSSLVLKGCYESESRLFPPLYVQGLSLSSETSSLLGPFKIVNDPFTHLEPLTEEESRGATKPAVEVTDSRTEFQKKKKRPVPMQLKWPKSGVLGDRKVALTDHSYLTRPAKRGRKPASDVSQKQSRKKTNTVDLSQSDSEMDEDSCNQDCEEMITINSLEEASTKTYKKQSNADSTALSSSSIFEPVEFDDLPPASNEITVGISGRAISHRYRLKNKGSGFEENRENIRVEKTSEGIVIESVQDNYNKDKPVSFTCRYCLKLLSSAATLFSHVRVVHAGAPDIQTYLLEIKERMKVKCPYCSDDVWILGYKNLSQHVGVFHSEMEPSVQLPTLPQLMEKMVQRKTQTGADSVILCHLCPATFKSNLFFEKHLQEHSKRTDPEINPENKQEIDKSSHLLKCKKCDMNFRTDDELRKHVSQIHGSESGPNCDICCNTFSSSNKLELHRSEEHEGRIPFHCPFCILGYKDKLNLYRHIGRVHLDVLPHKCPKCLKLFDRLTSLEHHIKKNHKDELESFLLELKKQAHELLECPYCSEVFKSGHPLVQHILDVHQDSFPFQCFKCSLRFLEKRLLQNHLVHAHRIVSSETSHSSLRTKYVKDTKTTAETQHSRQEKVIKSIEDLPVEAQNAVRDLQERGKSAVVIVNFHTEKSKSAVCHSPRKAAEKTSVTNLATKTSAVQADIGVTESPCVSNQFGKIFEIYTDAQCETQMLNLLSNQAEVAATAMKYVTIGDIGSLPSEVQHVSYPGLSVGANANIPACPAAFDDRSTDTMTSSTGLSYYEPVTTAEEDSSSYIEEYVYGVQPTEVVEEIVDDSGAETSGIDNYEEVITIPVSELAASSACQTRQAEILSGSETISAADFIKLIGEANLK